MSEIIEQRMRTSGGNIVHITDTDADVGGRKRRGIEHDELRFSDRCRGCDHTRIRHVSDPTAATVFSTAACQSHSCHCPRFNAAPVGGKGDED